MSNTVYEQDGYNVSVAYHCTYDGFPNDRNMIDETALIFNDGTKKRFWILKHDVHEIYDGLSLSEAMKLYRQRHEAGESGFWSDYNADNDQHLCI